MPSFTQRESIRETWGQVAKNAANKTVVLFFFGKMRPAIIPQQPAQSKRDKQFIPSLEDEPKVSVEYSLKIFTDILGQRHLKNESKILVKKFHEGLLDVFKKRAEKLQAILLQKFNVQAAELQEAILKDLKVPEEEHQRHLLEEFKKKVGNLKDNLQKTFQEQVDDFQGRLLKESKVKVEDFEEGVQSPFKNESIEQEIELRNSSQNGSHVSMEGIKQFFGNQFKMQMEEFHKYLQNEVKGRVDNFQKLLLDDVKINVEEFQYRLLNTFNSQIGEFQNRLLNESKIHGDIVQENFIDSYRNLSLKSVEILRWASFFCPNSKFVAKVDDDMYMNIPLLLTQLKAQLQRTPLFIMGAVLANNRPFRQKGHKWFVPVSQYKQNEYPNYLSGTAYSMSTTAAVRLYVESLYVKPIDMEDIYITGILADSSLIPRVHDNRFFGHSKVAPKGCGLKNKVSGHGVSPAEMRKIHRELYDPKLKC